MRVYAEHGVELFHGDCRDIVAGLEPESVDLLLTDPPYGQQYTGKADRGVGKFNIRADGARQGMRVVREMLFAAAPALRADAHVLIFCHWESWPDFYDAVASYVPIKNALIWWKDRGGMGDTELEYARDFEVILYAARGRRSLSGRRDGAVIRGFPPVVPERRLHPTEKPVGLLRYLIEKHAPAGGLVLDPFAGSGSTLEAARGLGARAIGVEIEARYCGLARERMAQGTLPGLAPGAA